MRVFCGGFLHGIHWRTIGLLLALAVFALGGVSGEAAGAAELEWNVFIHEWHLIGPFPRGLGNDYLDGDALPDISKTVKLDGQELHWQPYNRGGINLDAFFEPEKDNNACLAYAYTVINSPREQDAVIACGFDDRGRIYLNGEQVFEIQRNGGCTLDAFKAPIHLKKGENTLVLKIEDGSLSWEAIARIIPAGMEKPLLTVGCKLKKWHFISRPPVVSVELLDADGKTMETHRCSGFRLNEGYTNFPLYAPEPQTKPASVRVTLESEFYKPFQKIYPWKEAQDGVLPITLEGNLTVQGRLVDSGGKPVENAWFMLDTNPQEIRSDAEGRFVLTDVEPTWCPLHIFAEGYKYKQQSFEFSEVKSVEITLEEGGHVLKGTVRDEEGNPIEGAEIKYSRSTAVSDAQGRFVLAGLPDDRNTAYPSISHPDFVNKGGTNQPLNADRVTEVEYKLEKGGSISGKVTAKDNGKPIPGVQFSIGDSRYSGNIIRSDSPSGEDGRYLIKNIQPGQQIVHAISDDYAPAVETITVAKGKQAEIDFELDPGKDITGTIKDEEGNPIPGVRVISDTWKGYRMFQRDANTGEEGNFTLAHMPADAVEIHMFKQGYISKRDLQASGGEHHDIVLKKAFSCTVSVLLKDTGEAPEELSVDRGSQWQGNSRINWYPDYRQREWDKEKGSITFTFTESTTAEKILFRFRVPGYKQGIVEIPSSATQSMTESLNLERAPEGLKGRIVSKKTGEPVKELGLYVVNGNDQLRMDHYSDPRDALRSFSGTKTTTTENGEFELPYIENLESSMLVLLPEKEGCALISDLQKAMVDGKLQLTMPEMGTVKGLVLLAGEPVAGEPLHISWKPQGGNEWQYPFGYGGNASTDKDGHYEFTGLPAGSYTLHRVRSFDSPGGGRMSMYMGQDEVHLEEGGKVTFDYEHPAGVTVKGRTLITSDTPLGGCIVTLSGGDQGRMDAVSSDENGVFEFIHAPTGQISLQADLRSNQTFGSLRPGEEIARGRITVTIDEPTSVDITLKAKSMEIHQHLTGMTGDVVGKQAPAFAGNLFGTDKTFKLSEQKGKTVVLVFWSSDNEKCIESLPAIKKIAETGKIVLVSVSIDFEEDDLKSVIKEHDLQFPVIFSGDGLFDEIFTLYGMKSVPSAVVIDPEGNFASKRIGIEEVQAVVDTLLK